MSRKRRRALPLLVLAALALTFLLLGKEPIEMPAEGEPPRLYAPQCGQDLKETTLRILREAQTSLVLSVYEISDHDVLAQLRARAEEGVDVRLIVDPHHSPSRRQIGHKVHLTSRTGLDGLMHRKLFIVDRRQVWIGSANLTRASLSMHDNLVCGMECPAMADALIRCLEGERTDFPRAYIVGGQAVELWWLPQQRQALDRLVDLIDTAQKTVKVAMFTFTHPRLVAALVQAHARGVQVEVALDYKSSFGASKGAAKELKRAGIPLYRNSGQQLLHHKFGYIDEKTLVMGSANWTRSAFRINEEIVTILYETNEQQRRFLEKLWNAILLEARREQEDETPTLLQALGF